MIYKGGKKVMSPGDPQWDRFYDLLQGPEGCNFHKADVPGGFTWTCDCDVERPLTRKILEKYFPTHDVGASLAYFEQHGGYCDCEVIFNVED
jgi:hypothetical protein